METISCDADLCYIDRKIKGWLIDIALTEQHQATALKEVTYRKQMSVHRSHSSGLDGDCPDPTTSNPITTFAQSAPGADFHRFFVTPNTESLCVNANCPITTPHNLGRFYHDGQRAESPLQSDFGTPWGSLMAPVNHFFNYTVPPPNIIEAYLKMIEGQASMTDEDVVRRYQMNHCWSPIVPEYLTALPKSSDPDLAPISCLRFSPKVTSERQESFDLQSLEGQIDNGVDSHVHPAFRFNNKDKLSNEQKLQECSREVLRTSSLEHSQRSRRGHGVKVLGDKRCERRKLKRMARVESLRQRPDTRGLGAQRCLRHMPKGEDLRQVQLRLKESIVNIIAEQAIVVSQSGDHTEGQSLNSQRFQTNPEHLSSTDSLRTESIFSDEGEEGPEELDHRLEILAALMKKLEQSLNDGSFHDISLLDSQGKELGMASKFEYIRDMLRIVRKAFQQLLGDFNRSFRPTGIEVSNRELEAVFEEYLTVYEMLLERYPSMTIQDIIGSLDRLRRRARLEDLC